MNKCSTSSPFKPRRPRRNVYAIGWASSMTRSGRSSPPEASATSWPQQLVPAGETVFDVPPLLASRVRVLGSGRSQKNDPNDASSVAIAALRSHRVPRQELWVHGDDVRHARGEALEPSPGASATVSRFVRLSTEVGRRCPSSSTGSTRSASATAGRRSRSTARSSNWRWSGPVEVIGPPSGLTSDMTFTTPTTTPEPRLAGSRLSAAIAGEPGPRLDRPRRHSPRTLAGDRVWSRNLTREVRHD